MKRFIIIAISFLIAIVSNAQDRVDGEIRSFSFKSEVITEFMGWEYNTIKEKWVGNLSCISKIDYANGEYPAPEYGKSVPDKDRKNLQSVQTLKYENDGETYYIVDITFNGGYYRYPTIKEDWVTVLTHYSYILNNYDYQRFINPEDYQFFVDIDFYMWYDKMEDEDDVIKHLIYAKNKGLFSGSFAIKSYKDVIRFNFQGRYDHNILWMQGLGSLKAERLLETAYFEISKDEWARLVKETNEPFNSQNIPTSPARDAFRMAMFTE